MTPAVPRRIGWPTWTIFALGLMAVPLNVAIVWMWLYGWSTGDAEDNHSMTVFWSVAIASLVVMLTVVMGAGFAAHKRHMQWTVGLSVLQWLPPVVVLMDLLNGPG